MKADFQAALRLAQAGQAPVPGMVVAPTGIHEQLLASVAAREGAGQGTGVYVPTVTPARASGAPAAQPLPRFAPYEDRDLGLAARRRRGLSRPGRGGTTIEEALGEAPAAPAPVSLPDPSQPQAPALQPDVVPGAGADLRGGDGDGPEPDPGMVKALAAFGLDYATCHAAGHDLYYVPESITGGLGYQAGCRTCRIGGGVMDPSDPVEAALAKEVDQPLPLGAHDDLTEATAHAVEAAQRWPDGHPGFQVCPVCDGAGTIPAGSKGQVSCGRCGGEGEVPRVDLAKPYARVRTQAPAPAPVVESPAEEVADAVAPEEAGGLESPALRLSQCPEHATFQDWCLECHAALRVEAGEDLAEPEAPEAPAPVLTYDLPTDLYSLPPYCYVAGPAGTGKTFQAKAWAASDPEGVVLAATTGIAAVNLGEGCTINSLFKYYNTESLMEAFTGGWLEAQLVKLRRTGLRRVVLDEVSMLDGDQLTILSRAFDNVNQSRGADDPEVGLVLVGDFAQLPPVKASYAFESAEWDRYAQATYRLTTIRRQADLGFIEALQAIRRGDAATALAFFGPRLETTTHPTFDGTTILAKNEAVDKYNQLRLDKVQGATLAFPSTRWGKLRTEWGGPPKPRQDWGVPEVLKLKVGALVMVLANRNVAGPGEPPEYLYVNGDLGVVQEAQHGACLVQLQRTGEVVQVDPITRENTIPLEPGRRKALKAEGHPERISANGKQEVVGAVSYLPLRLAYASTVHRSQGLSLDTVQVNLRDPFFAQPGMVYVALSRARTAEGLRLVGTTDGLRTRIKTSPKVTAWL